ncbi:MAG: type I-E CRISPR-associated protein Cse2/CasB [Burkholderiaceae bacterium]|nr:type I-E CRISPR-associated protein Cse2/CasB [Burkholderiaceae bacterium]
MLRIAQRLSAPHVDRGLLAALRRFHPGQEGRHNVFEVQQVLLDAGLDLPPGSALQPRWGLLVHCLAIVQGAHQPRLDTGARLAELGLSEARLRQLVEADTPLLADLLPALARRLAAAGTAVDWQPLADLALADRDDPRTLMRADHARRRIVQGYLRAVAAKAAAGRPAAT